jgi:hypothetical protein
MSRDRLAALRKAATLTEALPWLSGSTARRSW